ncbi:MAG: hypothetical protein HYU66_01760 [Armatimonadetes bacterium]|nr:hypothetical protein [Armatimonadota bacterium]
MARSHCLTVALAGLLAATQAPAQTVIQAPVTGASLFKNGLAAITREATLPAAGEYVLEGMPVPIHGSFWVTPPPNGGIVEAEAFPHPRTRQAPARGMADLLRANLGRAVEIQTAEGWVSGTVKRLPDRIVATAPRSYNRGDDAALRYGEPVVTPTPDNSWAEALILATDKGDTALALNRVLSIRAPELATTFDETRPGGALRLKVDGGGAIQITYLCWGLTWAPSYRIGILDDKSARIELKASVLNDAEELKAARVHFVTGYPNLAFAGILDPLSLRGDTNDFLNWLSRPAEPRRSASMAQQVAMNVYDSADAEAPGPRGPEAPPGGQVEDLFFYPRDDVSLDIGARGYYPLLAANVPCKALYTWEIGSSLDDYNRWRGYERDDRGAIPPPPVWHVLHLTNKTQMPWTTGPALSMRDGLVLGQDLLTYTGRGREVDVKVTRAANVRAEHRETEIARERSATRFYGSAYDRITVKGEMRLFNDTDREIRLRVTRSPLDGELVSAAPAAESRALAERLNAVNPRQELRWELSVSAGDKLYVTYQYKVYVRG